MTTTASGLKYSDAKLGAGEFPTPGTRVTIEYVMATMGSRQGVTKLDSTKEHEEPYTFVLGDLDVIAGLQEAISTMLPGGVRRVIIPSTLGYTSLSKKPVPPRPDNFQRFRVIYNNPNRVRQPDMIFDVKLFSFQGR